MNLHRTAALLAVLVLGLFAIPASVSAHTASATCGTVIVANTPGNHPALIYQQPAHTLLYGPVGNGSYAATGLVQVRWPAWDNDTHYVNLSIAPCEQPTPTPTPSPTATPTPSPTPTPTPLSCANTPNLCAQPTPTPSPTPAASPTPTPDPTPTPQLVTSPPDFPTITPPPTNTAATSPVGDANLAVGLFLLFVAVAGALALTWPRERRG